MTAHRTASQRARLQDLIGQISWAQWRHHPWRTATAVMAIALGVALAFSVHLMNESALGEFSAAVRQVNAQPDFELRGPRTGFDESIYERVATDPAVTAASPVVEIDTYARGPAGERVAVRVVGIDALQVMGLAPQLLPQAAANAPRLAWFDPHAVFLNAAAETRLLRSSDGAGSTATLDLQSGSRWQRWTIQGRIAAEGPPLLVMDIAGAQAAFDRLGRISRIDVRLQPGEDALEVQARWALPPDVRVAKPDEAAQRTSHVSRAYRVNLTVLALVALFTGAFLVFSILALSVAQRLPELALIGVMGLSARERLRWILAEALLLGALGSLLGLVVGTALAWVGLRLLAGDLGGSYFPGVQPHLRFGMLAALGYGALGVMAAVAGGWAPARMAAGMAPAQALKGLGLSQVGNRARDLQRWLAPALLVLSVALAFAPPVAGLPLAAYGSVALLLLGGIACVPLGVRWLLAGWHPRRDALALLAVERARHQQHAATVAVAGVVASLSLAVALTVMVASFRSSIIDWLDTVLPADLYARTATGTAAADAAYLDPAFVLSVQGLPGVARLEALRQSQVVMDPHRPAVALVARPIAAASADKALPLVGGLQARTAQPPGTTAVYVSEAMVNLYGARAGETLTLPLPSGGSASAWVRGVWRDYARQSGSIVIDREDFVRLTGDERVNDLAVWLSPGTQTSQVQAAIRQLTESAGNDAVPMDFATPGEIRQLSLRIFDRSFAVTYWLQAVAIGIGLFGIAASFSAQVLTRRKEFGLLSHLGLTRRQILTVVACEGAVWSGVGAGLGLLLGLAVSVVLVHVVNPQSFNWTMDLKVPGARLLALGLAVVAAGTVTAWWAARSAARRDQALAVKEDW